MDDEKGISWVAKGCCNRYLSLTAITTLQCRVLNPIVHHSILLGPAVKLMCMCSSAFLLYPTFIWCTL